MKTKNNILIKNVIAKSKQNVLGQHKNISKTYNKKMTNSKSNVYLSGRDDNMVSKMLKEYQYIIDLETKNDVDGKIYAKEYKYKFCSDNELTVYYLENKEQRDEWLDLLKQTFETEGDPHSLYNGDDVFAAACVLKMISMKIDIDKIQEGFVNKLDLSGGSMATFLQYVEKFKNVGSERKREFVLPHNYYCEEENTNNKHNQKSDELLDNHISLNSHKDNSIEDDANYDEKKDDLIDKNKKQDRHEDIKFER